MKMKNKSSCFLAEMIFLTLLILFVSAEDVVGCEYDYDCAVDECCENGDCVFCGPLGCTGDEDCAVDECCENGDCVFCSTSGCTGEYDCDVGQCCNTGTGECEPCMPSQECWEDHNCEENQYCDEQGQCVSCSPECTSEETCDKVCGCIKKCQGTAPCDDAGCWGDPGEPPGGIEKKACYSLYCEPDADMGGFCMGGSVDWVEECPQGPSEWDLGCREDPNGKWCCKWSDEEYCPIRLCSSDGMHVLEWSDSGSGWSWLPVADCTGKFCKEGSVYSNRCITYQGDASCNDTLIQSCNKEQCAGQQPQKQDCQGTGDNTICIWVDKSGGSCRGRYCDANLLRSEECFVDSNTKDAVCSAPFVMADCADVSDKCVNYVGMEGWCIVKENANDECGYKNKDGVNCKGYYCSGNTLLLEACHVNYGTAHCHNPETVRECNTERCLDEKIAQKEKCVPDGTASYCDWELKLNCRGRYCDDDTMQGELCELKDDQAVCEQMDSIECNKMRCVGAQKQKEACITLLNMNGDVIDGRCDWYYAEDCDPGPQRCSDNSIKQKGCVEEDIYTAYCGDNLVQKCKSAYCKGGDRSEAEGGGTKTWEVCSYFDDGSPYCDEKQNVCDPSDCQYCSGGSCQMGLFAGCGYDAVLGSPFPNICQMCLLGFGCVNSYSCGFPTLPGGNQCLSISPNFINSNCVYDYTNCEEPYCGRYRCVSNSQSSTTVDQISACGVPAVSVAQGCGYSLQAVLSSCGSEDDEIPEDDFELDLELPDFDDSSTPEEPGDDDSEGDAGEDDLDADTDSDEEPELDAPSTPDVDGADLEADVPDADADVDGDSDIAPDSEADFEGDVDVLDTVDDVGVDGDSDIAPDSEADFEGDLDASDTIEPDEVEDIDFDFDLELEPELDTDVLPETDLETDEDDGSEGGGTGDSDDFVFPDGETDVPDGVLTPELDFDIPDTADAGDGDVDGNFDFDGLETPDGDGDNDVADFDFDGLETPDGDNPGTTCREYVFNMSWGALGSGSGQFNNPRGVAVNSKGQVYVLDKENDRMQKFTENGVFIREITNPILSKPCGIAFKADDSYFVTVTLNVGGGHTVYAVLEFSADDEIVRSITYADPLLDAPMDVAVSSDRIVIANSGNGKIYVAELNGVFIREWTTLLGGDLLASDPRGVALDSQGFIYVADYANHKVKKFNENGDLIYWWGGSTVFNYPWDVYVDAYDYIYVSDYNNHRIQKFDSEGAPITSFGVHGTGDGEFINQVYVYENGAGKAYVSDGGNTRIQKWACNHTLCTIYDVVLDVANDSTPPWEWNITDTDYIRERVWADPEDVVTKLNDVLRRGCISGACMDCSIEGGDCIIPFSFRSAEPAIPYLIKIGGDLSVDDINFSYWIVDTIADVPYADRFRFSEGGNWTIRYEAGIETPSGTLIGNVTVPVPLDFDCRDLCFNILYEKDKPPEGLDAHDAIDDAMYRLLDEELDVDPKDGVIEMLDFDRDGVNDTYFDPESMWFDAQDNLGIQSLWGPTAAKLIIWEGN